MKVKELIKELEKLDGNKGVEVHEESEFLNSEIIYIDDSDDEVVTIEFRGEE